MMINNKQINVWRGDQEPPTIYHVWLYNSTKLLLHNGTEWVIFIDDAATVTRIDELAEQIENVKQSVSELEQHTINHIAISENPVLTGEDIMLNATGSFLTGSDSIAQSLQKLDRLLTTQIIE